MADAMPEALKDAAADVDEAATQEIPVVEDSPAEEAAPEAEKVEDAPAEETKADDAEDTEKSE